MWVIKKLSVFLTKILSLLLVLIVIFILIIYRPVFFRADKSINNLDVDSEKLKDYVTILSTKFGSRSWDSPETLNLAGEFIYDEFKKINQDSEKQVFNVEGREYFNVISQFGDREMPRIVVGAHYDTFLSMPGADDNASGVAGLLELARLLKKHPIKVPVTLVAFTLEEPPHFRSGSMGSAVHAMSLKSAGVPVKLMISLEMIGYFTDQENSQEYPSPVMKYVYPSKGNFIAIVDQLNLSSVTYNIKRAFLENTNIAAYSINAPRSIPGIDFSDHQSYWEAGFDAVMVTDTAFFRNLNYHTSQDTYEKLDYRRMAEVVKGIYAYLGSLN